MVCFASVALAGENVMYNTEKKTSADCNQGSTPTMDSQTLDNMQLLCWSYPSVDSTQLSNLQMVVYGNAANQQLDRLACASDLFARTGCLNVRAHQGHRPPLLVAMRTPASSFVRVGTAAKGRINAGKLRTEHGRGSGAAASSQTSATLGFPL